MKISLMWPTRKRTSELVFSLSSFIQRAKDNSNIEYIVVIDPDDTETSEALERQIENLKHEIWNLEFG